MRRARLRRTLGLLCTALAADTPARAADFAEVDLLWYAIGPNGPPALFGYAPVDDSELVFEDETVTPLGPHDDHEDEGTLRERRYRAAERVNTSRAFGTIGGARGAIEAGHSLSVATGWADAGGNDLGGFAEAHAGLLGPSEGTASSEASIEKRITIEAGESGLAAGDLVTGLRWVFDGDGLLSVGGRSFPNDTGASAGASIQVRVLRGPTGTCGAFDCPNGALAVAATLSTGLAAADANPALPAGVSARIQRHDSWSASNNAGVLKAGAVFTSGSETSDVGLAITDEDVAIASVEAVRTGAAPLGLEWIEFEANVGETLVVEMSLDLVAGVVGWGNAESDFFGTFVGHVEDPLARGLVFASSVPEPGATAQGALAATALALLRVAAARAYSRTRRPPSP